MRLLLIGARPRASLGIALLSLSLACIGPGDPQPIRYFSAEVTPVEAALATEPGTPEGGALRLRYVEAAGHLKERIVWRASDVEYGFYELRRWTEAPAVWLERALAHALFQARGFERTEAAAAPALDIELVAFEEYLGDAHEAHVAVELRLSESGGAALLEKRIERRVPIADVEPTSVARAVREGLAGVVAEVARAVASSGE